jgi:hypothetical protein
MRTTPVVRPGSAADRQAQAAKTGLAIVHPTGTPINLVIAEPDYQEPLIVGSFGGPGAGKSYLLATAPSLGLIPTERKSKGTVIRVAEKLGREVYVPDAELIRTGNPMLIANLPNTCIVIGDDKHKGWTAGQIQDEMQEIADTIKIDSDHPTCCKRHYYRWHVNRVKSVAFTMALDSPHIKTIGIDTFGTFVDDVSFANYGLTGVIDAKEFGFAPREDMVREIRDFLNTIATKNLILTHHSKSVWRDNKPTNKNQLDGKFSKLGHDVSVMIEQTRNDGVVYGDGRYCVSVRDCQANAELIGLDLLMDEDVTFQKLAVAVYPDSEEEDWV